MYIYDWPRLPLLIRYKKNVSYKGKTFGDLASMSGNSDYRQMREISFETDSFGFRNDKFAFEKKLDLILLGDSFGVGTGTTQDKNMASIFTKKYNLNTYNLSMQGSPWHELMNLKIEFNRLKCHERTTVLWAIFTGNDLDEYFSNEMHPRFLNNNFKCFLVWLKTYRRRSPIVRLLVRSIDKYSWASRVIAKDFLDGKKILFYDDYLHRANRKIKDILQHENFSSFKMVFKEMREFAKLNNLTVAVVLIPSKEEIYPWMIDGNQSQEIALKPSAFSVVLKKVCQSEEFTFLDLKPYFIYKAKQVFDISGELLWWYDDTYWNDRGHEVAASIIYKRLLLPFKND